MYMIGRIRRLHSRKRKSVNAQPAPATAATQFKVATPPLDDADRYGRLRGGGDGRVDTRGENALESSREA